MSKKKTTWSRWARWVDNAAGASFVLLAVATGLVYFAGTYRQLTLIEYSAGLSFVAWLFELFVALAGAYGLGMLSRLGRESETQEALARSSSTENIRAQVILTSLTAWPISLGVLGALIACSHIVAWSPAITAFAGMFGLLTIFCGLHWNRVGVYRKLARLIEANR
ncbi:hypothetical protein PQR66_08995 [Paraburkholderia agricolaris]|uniref:Uncharacterized protein n=1 Tax=Paraburkholderia agricolaris TaxID=2152888 RepID=A0ABW8ZIW9_9BURK